MKTLREYLDHLWVTLPPVQENEQLLAEAEQRTAELFAVTPQTATVTCEEGVKSTVDSEAHILSLEGELIIGFAIRRNKTRWFINLGRDYTEIEWITVYHKVQCCAVIHLCQMFLDYVEKEEAQIKTLNKNEWWIK